MVWFCRCNNGSILKVDDDDGDGDDGGDDVAWHHPVRYFKLRTIPFWDVFRKDP